MRQFSIYKNRNEKIKRDVKKSIYKTKKKLKTKRKKKKI